MQKKDYDVIVLGSGIAGLGSAVAAQKLGLRTLVLEVSDLLGGGTCHSTGLIWIGCNHLARAAGLPDEPDWVQNYMRFLGGGQEDPRNMQALIDTGPPALEFFENCGIKFRLVKHMADHYFGVAPNALAEGRTLETTLISSEVLGEWEDKLRRTSGATHSVTAEELVEFRAKGFPPGLLDERQKQHACGLGVGVIVHFLHAALKLGVEFRTNQKTSELLLRDGRVQGVRLADGELIEARRGVVLATGGYESNPEMIRQFEGLPNWRTYFPASIRGDAIPLGTRAGAAVSVVQNNMQLFLGFPMPKPGQQGPAPFRLAGIIELCSPHTMVVNKSGRRFANESVFQLMAARLRDFDVDRHAYANLPCFLLFDRRFTEQFSFGGLPVGEIPAWVKRSDTLEGLAQELGIDAAELGKTVSRFNGFAATGVDTDFGRAGDLRFKNRPSLGSLEVGPFYGTELNPAGSCSAGLLTDVHSNVVTQEGEPLPGLYAVGNAACKRELGTGYQAGLTIASGMVFGLRSARHMAGA